MAETEKLPDDAWRLDDSSSAPDLREPALTPVTTAIPTNLSHDRLTRPVYVVTAEHLAWYVIAVYVLVTRIVALGARPIDPAQGTDAVAAFLIARHGRAALALADASWVTIVQASIFNAIGATDATSRIVVTVCGLLLVAIAFAMRPVLGRAGALAFAALISISPSLTYFSRGGSTMIASVALMMVAIAIAESLRRRPGIVRAAGLGVAIALWLTADPIGYVTALATLLSLILVGAVDAMRMDHQRLRLRVWWARRRAAVIMCAIVALGAWIELTTAFFHRPLVPSVAYFFGAILAPPSDAFPLGIRRLVPILGFYEFIVVALAVVGAFAIVTRRVGDRFAIWSVVWAFVTIATLLTLSTNHPHAVVAILLPLAILAAYAVECIHQLERWTSVRYAVAAAVAVTLCVQLTTNFVYPAPDTSEAPWRRHALLFWTEPTTSIRTVRECERVRREIPATAASAFIPDDAPQVQWYLRDFEQTASPKSASIVVTIAKTQPGSMAGDAASGEFGFEEWWTPKFSALTAGRAIDYLFTQRAWSDVEIRDLAISVPPPKAAQ
jgi:predicted membrane-bound mannosyltransferase